MKLTPFEEVYNRFLSSITDYNLARLSDTVLKANMEQWLSSAIAAIPNPSNSLKNVDFSLESFNGELTHTESEIVSKFMLSAYINTHLMREEYLSQSINSKDYRSYSSASQLKAILDLQKSIVNDANVLISRNSYSVERVMDKFNKNKKGK